MTGTTGTVSQPQKALPYFIPQKTNHLNFKSLFLAGLPYSPSIMKHHQSSILKNFTRINRGSLNGPRCLRVWWWVINWSYFVAPRNVQARISTATFCWFQNWSPHLYHLFPSAWLVSTLIWSAYDSKDSFVSILLSVLLTGWFWNNFWNIFLEVLSFWKPKLLSYLIHRYGRSFFPTISKSLAMLLEDPVFWAMAF